MIAYIHEITHNSKVNGPNERTVIHFQGCTLNCLGCFNTSTHPMKSGKEYSVDSLFKEIPVNQKHITISGGEPILQSSFLLLFLKKCKENNLNIVLFSGFYKHEIEKIKEGNEILSLIDVLIDGRYDETVKTKDLKGSNNQNVHLFTNTYKLSDFQSRKIEVLIDENGELRMTGFPTKQIIDGIKN